MRILIVAALWGIFLFNPSLKAQYYYYNKDYYESAVLVEVGGSFGIMNALTDLGGKKGVGKGFIKDLNWKNSNLAYGAFLTATYKSMIGLRLEATFGKITGYDSILKDVRESTTGRYERNLSFRSNIMDFQAGLEIHPLFFKDYGEDESPYLSPYLFAGVGYFSFDPQTYLNGQWYSLQPLRTEGQGFAEYPDREPYQLNQVNFSAGLGVKYEINSLLSARFEVNHRFLKTDYLDDVSTNYIDASLFSNYLPTNMAAVAQQLYSRRAELDPSDITLPGQQRGDPKDKDSFFTIMVKLSLTLGRSRR